MSRWTHVDGTLRFSGSSEAEWHALRRRLSEHDRRADTPPHGSEGSFDVEWDDYDHDGARQRAIRIHGNLRDFGGQDDIRRIRDWLQVAVGPACVVGTVTIQDELHENSVTLTQNDAGDFVPSGDWLGNFTRRVRECD